MEIALVSAAMIGVGMAYVKATEGTHGVQPEQERTSTGGSTAAPTRLPDAANAKAGLHASATVNASASMMAAGGSGVGGFDTAAARGGLGARRDTSLFVDAVSPYEHSMERMYGPPVGTKREVERSIDPSTRADNVLVRSNIGYRDEFFRALEKPVRMHNVNPIATTTGTAHQLVGPGVGAGAGRLTGDHGFHYGAVRMKPNIVHNTFREQKGHVIPGKNPIDAGESAPVMHEHARTGYTIGTAGFGPMMETDAQPMRFHAISREYLTSAPGRATVTGVPGAGGRRLEPVAVTTNRGADSAHLRLQQEQPEGAAWTAMPGRGGAVVAATSREAYARDPSLATDRGRVNEYLGPAAGAVVPGHARTIANFDLATEERGSTEQMRGLQVLNVSNPGQPATLSPEPGVGARASTGPPTTHRQLASGFPVTNASPQVPLPGQGGTNDTTVHTEGHNVDLRSTQRVANAFRPGVASSAVAPERGGQYNLQDAYAGGSLVQRTQRESHERSEFTAPLKATGVNAPMSYSAMLRSEGYSNRDVPQMPFVPPASPPTEASVHMGLHAIGTFDARSEPSNSTREGGGGVGNQNLANFHVQSTELPHNANPNRVERLNTRLDPQIIEALEQNELQLDAHGHGSLVSVAA